ncbi:transmembrane protein 163-like [Oppia nitens]|uniref:transmembrane protein 163-like n=1 Tax=Oppia nitens TaxID=1686743 RepID=UPI0023DC1CD6|nr:transmembrane protein 163-like [Oppia nitens]
MLFLMAYNFALHISIASIAIDFVLAVGALLTGTSSSNCAFAVDCLLDVFSNAILVWRFYGDSNGRPTPPPPVPEKSSLLASFDRHPQFQLSGNQSPAIQRKELLACLGLGIMFILSGVIVIGKSAWDLVSADEVIDLEPDMNGLPGILHVTSVAFVICGLLALGKYMLYKHMNSQSMYLESINSWISSILALVIVISTMIIQYDNNLWILDPIVSIVFSVFMIVYGVYNIRKSDTALRVNRESYGCYKKPIQLNRKRVEYIMIP